MFKEVKKKKKFEEVLDQIKELLTTKKLKTGQKLPNEIELSESLGVSRSSLREAYTILSILGIIEGRSGEGTIIKEAQPENLKSIMSLVAVSNGMNTNELFEVRIILEKAASSMAAENRSEKDLERIYNLLSNADRSYANQDAEEQTDYDFLFHKSVVESSKNRMLVMLIDVISDLLGEQIVATRSKLATSPEILMRFHKEHWSMYEAIKSSDPEAAQSRVENHLRNAQIDLGLAAQQEESSM